MILRKWTNIQNLINTRQFFSITKSISEFNSHYKTLKAAESYKGKIIEKIGGRVIGRRDNSNRLIFLDLGSNGRKVQILLNLREFSDPAKFEKFKLEIKRGTLIGVSGYPLKTKVGELSLMANEISIFSHSANPLPIMNRQDCEMLKDDAKRFSMRCLDFIVNPSHMEYIFLRSALINEIRGFLQKNNFLEVETPILCSKAGGALAKPFKTESSFLKKNLELRIAPELFLKELIVSGFERVFEIGRVFRNEGISPLHNPEFTMCEFYAAYKNCEFLLPFVEEMIRGIVQKITKTGKILVPDEKLTLELDFMKPFEKYDIVTEFEKYFNRKIDISEPQKFETLLEKCFIDYVNQNKKEFPENNIVNIKQKTDYLISEIIERKCIQPSFIMNHPTFMSPLAKSHAKMPLLTERFELFVNKSEISNGYSELDNYEIQRERFIEQQKMRKAGNDAELHEEDKHFIEVLKYGMPPTAGCGIGIDRLCMLLAGVSHIREVIAFPHFRSSVVES